MLDEFEKNQVKFLKMDKLGCGFFKEGEIVSVIDFWFMRFLGKG